MQKHNHFVFYILVIMAMVVQACTPSAPPAIQAPEQLDPLAMLAAYATITAQAKLATPALQGTPTLEPPSGVFDK